MSNGMMYRIPAELGFDERPTMKMLPVPEWEGVAESMDSRACKCDGSCQDCRPTLPNMKAEVKRD